jgi:hypothetical protein
MKNLMKKEKSFEMIVFQMLANVDFGMTSPRTTSLVDDSTLCAKKDIIIQKFDQLLKKLGGEVFYGNFFLPLLQCLKRAMSISICRSWP